MAKPKDPRAAVRAAMQAMLKAQKEIDAALSLGTNALDQMSAAQLTIPTEPDQGKQTPK